MAENKVRDFIGENRATSKQELGGELMNNGSNKRSGT